MKIKLRTILLAALLTCSFAYVSSASAVSAYFSDCQSNNTVLSRVVQKIVPFHPQTVFIGGDITYSGNRQNDFDVFFTTMQPLTTEAEIFPAFGNHDRDKGLFLKNFPQVDSLTYYYVERDSVIWIILNTNLKLAPGSPQYIWLVSKLQTYRDRTIVMIHHHPVFSSGPHSYEQGFDLLLAPLYSKYGVAAVFSGHDHIYERSVKDSVQYVVFGGAGGQLYEKVTRNDYSILFRRTHGFIILTPVSGRMQVTAYNLDDEIIDQFSFVIKSKAEQIEQAMNQ
ncbi:MAG TPA: metallophosphoesterase [Candidatus Cloacimonadota bacterium]|nr:metallophosphoesterase [Candidatus Cloacimonadota bacterium]